MNVPFRKLLAGAGLLTLTTGVYGADLWRVYEIALESDPQLAAAEAAYQAVQEVIPQTRAGLLPILSAGANWNRTSTDIKETTIGTTGTSDYDSNGYSLTLTQPLFRYERWVQVRQADSRVAQAEAEFGSVQQGLALRVAQAYFNVLAARDNLDFAEAEVKATQQQLRQAEQRFEVGLSAITDVHEARAAFDAAVAQEIAARNQVAVAREALRAITGVSFETLAPLQAQIPLVAPEPQDIDAWVETATQGNLELLAAASAARVANLAIDEAQAGHYPTLDLQAQHAYTDASDNPSRGLRATDDTIVLNLNLPLYQGGLTSSRVREANYRYNQARELLEDQRRSTVRQTREAYLNVVAGISQVKARAQAVSSARTALEATQAGYEVGTRTAVDVLANQRELFRVQRDFARSRYDYILATLNLKQAAGALLADDIRAINGWLDQTSD